MTSEIGLTKLNDVEKNPLILRLLPLVGQLEAALAQIAELETWFAKLERPAKTLDNSSFSLSKGQKSSTLAACDKPRPKGRSGVARALEPNIAVPPRRAGARLAIWQTDRGAGGLHALSASVGLERPRCLFGEVVGLPIGEGAFSDILARARTPLNAAAIAAQVTTADVAASDETSVRMMKKTCWEWVFLIAAAVLHIIRLRRRPGVGRTLLGQARPRVWVSDSLGSQRGHADLWQVCLAHLLRDAQYVIGCGDGAFSVALTRLLLQAIAIERRRERLRDATLAPYRTDLNLRLDRVLALSQFGSAAEKPRRRVARNREHLFVFITSRDVPATNNVPRPDTQRAEAACCSPERHGARITMS